MSVQDLAPTISAQLVGRDREAQIIALALVAGEHVLLVGPPGTAKSHLCRTAAHAISDALYGEWLLSPTTAPEEVFGPYDIAGLRDTPSRYERVGTGRVTSVHLAYLDEVGRASPAILDTMLHLLGPERQALIGTKQVKVPLVSAIGSANTWPEDAAMLDRWLLRVSVAYLPPSQRRALMTFNAPSLTSACTLEELRAAQATARSIPWEPAAYETLDAILGDLDEAGIAVSDRRLRASLKIAAAAAVLAGHASVQPIDLEPLQFVLWSVPDQAPICAQKVVARANPLGAKLDELLSEADEIVRDAVDQATRVEAATKLDSLLTEAKQIAGRPGSNGRAAKVVKYLANEHTRINARILGISEDRIARMLAD